MDYSLEPPINIAGGKEEGGCPGTALYLINILRHIDLLLLLPSSDYLLLPKAPPPPYLPSDLGSLEEITC